MSDNDQDSPHDPHKKAVALKYDTQGAGVPQVTAKGRGLIAEKIIELAKENNIHIHESPELVDVLVQLELGSEIPEALYRAIAEVIAFAYQLNRETDGIRRD